MDEKNKIKLSSRQLYNFFRDKLIEVKNCNHSDDKQFGLRYSFFIEPICSLWCALGPSCDEELHSLKSVWRMRYSLQQTIVVLICQEFYHKKKTTARFSWLFVVTKLVVSGAH